MLDFSYALAEPLSQDMTGGKSFLHSIKYVLIGFGLGCALIWMSGSAQQPAAQRPTLTMALSTLQPAMANAEAKAARSAVAFLRHRPHSRRTLVEATALVSGLKRAPLDGARAGCRGDLTCVRAVGLFWGTSTGKTEEVAGMISQAAGLESQDVGDVSPGDLAGYDGLIVGLPTWHTGADEQRSGTAWDDYLEQLRGMDFCGKPVAVFGTGDSQSYGDNFCDGIEELHSTFEAAGAKMLGYVSSEGYQHAESKSERDGKFLGLPLDQDNEDDLSEGRVKAWVDQLKSEGMPLLN